MLRLISGRLTAWVEIVQLHAPVYGLITPRLSSKPEVGDQHLPPITKVN
ncbi:hypothetical protein AB7W58_10130 [Providencia rettgeri]